MAVPQDPTPEQIAAACLEIQATWTPAEKMKRLRPDLRPQYTRCDGISEDIDAEDYDEHHERRERLLEAPPLRGSSAQLSLNGWQSRDEFFYPRH